MSLGVNEAFTLSQKGRFVSVEAPSPRTNDPGRIPAEDVVGPAQLPVLDLARVATRVRRRAVVVPACVGAGDLVPIARARLGAGRRAQDAASPASRSLGAVLVGLARRCVPPRGLRIAVLTGILVGLLAQFVEERFLRDGRAPASEGIEVPEPSAPHRAIAGL